MLSLIVNFGSIKEKLIASVMTIFLQKYNSITIDSQPNPKSLNILEERVILLCEKSQAKVVGDLKFQLMQGLKNTESVDKISQRVKEVFTGTDFEIERIVRTEILNASNAGDYEGNIDMGAKWKSWAAHFDKRTAGDSKRLNGQVQRIDDLFVDPGGEEKTCMYPPLRPMDRCTVMYYIDKPKTTRKNGMDYL